MVKDMTRGKPLQVILLFCGPLVLGSLFQQFYSMADTLIVGRFVGVTALAGVGSTGSLSFLVLGFVFDLWKICWVVWPVGGLLCGIAALILSGRK